MQAQLAKKLGIKAAPVKAAPVKTALNARPYHAVSLPMVEDSDDALDTDSALDEACGGDFDWQSDMEDSDLCGNEHDGSNQYLPDMRRGNQLHAANGADTSNGDDDDDYDDCVDDEEEEKEEEEHNNEEEVADDVVARQPKPTSHAYKPPALRAAASADEASSRRVRGLLNRLAEGTLAWVVSQLEVLHNEDRQAVEMHVIDQLIEVGTLLQWDGIDCVLC